MQATNIQKNPYRNMPTNRSFGFLFASIVFIFGLYSLWRTATSFGWWLLALSFFIACVTIVRSVWLTPLNKLWFHLGVLLGRIFSPMVLGGMFFLLITPVGIFTRIFGRDVLRIKKPQVESYWLNRDPNDITSESFKNQF